MSDPALTPQEFDPTQLDTYVQACTRIEAAMAVAKDFGETGGINNQASVDRAAEVLALVKDVHDEIESNRLASTVVLRERQDAINKAFKEIRGPVEGVMQALKGSIGQFNREQREKADELQAKLDEEAAEEQAKEEQEAAEEGREAREIQAPEVSTSTSQSTATGSVSGSQIRKYRVTDFSKLPDEFKKEDKGALNRAAKSGKDNVPGVEFYFDENVSVSRSK